mgnify:CR=1 FL=1
MRICLVLEGCYPYVHGGVSTWMHSYIEAMKEHEFVLWVIGAKAEDRGKFVYDLPDNVVEVHEVFLDDALRLSGERAQVSFTEEELRSLRELVNLGSQTGMCCSTCSTPEACIRCRSCKAVNSSTCLRKSAWKNIRMWPTPTLSIPCAPCCCRCCT